MKLPARFFLSACFTLSCFVLELSAVNRVAVRAEAWDEFTTDRARDPAKKVMTYKFLKGRFHPGSINDPSMQVLSFEDIVYDIALNLEKQNFFPDTETETTDMLIVVHWGLTHPQEDSLMDMMGYTSLEDLGSTTPDQSIVFNNPSNISSELEFNYNASLSIAESNDRSDFYKAQLLGMEEAFDETGSRSEERFLKHLINEERYFIILMAYDFQKLKEGETVLLWRTRYSIRALGQSFTAAVGNMNEIASDYFGKNMKGLINKRVDDTSDVKIGELEVLGNEQAEEATN